MADGAEELRELSESLAAIADAGWAVPMVEALADEWVEVSQREVPVDTGQTKARTAVSHVGGSKAHARAEVVSDTPYAGWVELRWRPYFTDGQRAAKELAEAMGGPIETEIRRVLNSGGHPNPRSLFR